MILRANSRSDLCAAKRILRFAILALYSNHLEVELLTNCGTRLTNRSANCVVCTVNATKPDPNQVFCIFRRFLLLFFSKKEKI